MSLQRLYFNLAARLRLNSHSQAALQTAARHLATRSGDTSSSDAEHEELKSATASEQAGVGPSKHVEEEPGIEESAKSPTFRVPGAEGAVMLSKELEELWKEVERFDEEEFLAKVTKEELQPERPPPKWRHAKGEGDESDLLEEALSDNDYRLLLETIRLYFATAPGTDEEVDGMNDEDREILAELGRFLQDELEGPALKTVNIAPPGRLPWEVLDVDEERGLVQWGVDLTEGRAQEPWRNALLSNEAKEHMWELHQEDPEVFSVENLAKEFRIRQQRVMAILALKQMEHEARAQGKPVDDELQAQMDELHGCDEAVGSFERHYTVLPSYPNYKELENHVVVSRLEAKLGKPLDEISEDDLTPELAREVLGVVYKEEVEEELAAREEKSLIEEFRRNLEFNMGKIGKGIKRSSRKRHAPSRPKEGWSLVVTPLGTTKDPHQQAEQSFVAKPNGEQRQLTEDELLYLQRAAALPRRKIL